MSAPEAMAAGSNTSVGARSVGGRVSALVHYGQSPNSLRAPSALHHGGKPKRQAVVACTTGGSMHGRGGTGHPASRWEGIVESQRGHLADL